MVSQLRLDFHSSEEPDGRCMQSVRLMQRYSEILFGSKLVGGGGGAD